jgi:hypothetical protein
MYFFQDLKFQKYMELKVQREFLKTKISELQLELSQSELVFNMLDSIYNPKVSIQEVKNPVMGHRFIGKVRVLEPNGKGKIHGFSIARADKFKGIDDPKLIELAKNRAMERIKISYPHYFS